MPVAWTYFLRSSAEVHGFSFCASWLLALIPQNHFPVSATWPVFGHCSLFAFLLELVFLLYRVVLPDFSLFSPLWHELAQHHIE